MWPNCLRFNSSYWKVPGSIPGEAFFIFFSKSFIFSLTLRRFCDSARKNAKLRPLKIIQINLKKGLGDDKTHGLWRPLDVILLCKIEGIYTFNATNLHQNAVKNYLKLSQI